MGAAAPWADNIICSANPVAEHKHSTQRQCPLYSQELATSVYEWPQTAPSRPGEEHGLRHAAAMEFVRIIRAIKALAAASQNAFIAHKGRLALTFRGSRSVCSWQEPELCEEKSSDSEDVVNLRPVGFQEERSILRPHDSSDQRN